MDDTEWLAGAAADGDVSLEQVSDRIDQNIDAMDAIREINEARKALNALGARLGAVKPDV